MSPSRAKAIIKAFLDERKLPYTKLTARTIDFTDLARGTCVFVKVHGWKPSLFWNDMSRLARDNGFRIEE